MRYFHTDPIDGPVHHHASLSTEDWYVSHCQQAVTE